MNTTTNTESKMETKAVHKFEAAGLGKAPFKFVGMIEQDLCYGRAILNREEYQKTGISVTTAPGGSCDYCGQYIVHMFKVRSSDGRTFKVGSDCIEKTGDAGLKKVVNAIVAKRNTKARHAREAAAIKAGEEWLATDEVKAFLVATPSLTKWCADKGETLADYVSFVWVRSGSAGRLRLIKAIRLAFAAAGARS